MAGTDRPGPGRAIAQESDGADGLARLEAGLDALDTRPRTGRTPLRTARSNVMCCAAVDCWRGPDEPGG